MTFTFDEQLQNVAQAQANALVRFDADIKESLNMSLATLECFCEINNVRADKTFTVEISTPNSCFTDKKEVTLIEMLHACIDMSKEFEKEDF